MILRADATHIPLVDKSVDLVFGSPPYCDARTYGIGADRKVNQWIKFMVDCTVGSLRVSKGPVVWVCAGTGSANYNPGPEGLIYTLWSMGIPVLRPCCWTSNKPPTGSKWFTGAWEYVMAFGTVKYFDVPGIATKIKYGDGGKFRMRNKHGNRVGGSNYPKHGLRKTAPNVFHVTVGGGHLGSRLAHENEAPFPEKLVEPFAKALCPPDGIVYDPFSGSGTTAAVAKKFGRRFVASDIRQSQCELTRRRLEETQYSKMTLAKES